MLDSESSLFGPVIYAYTRVQALADGVLVDLSDLALEAGFRWPVAVTERLFHAYLVPSLELASDGQSIEGRTWDLLNILRVAILGSKDDSYITFSVLFQMAPGKSPLSVDLVAVCGPGDHGEPVLTILLPDED